MSKKISIMDHPEYRKAWDRLMSLRARIEEAEKNLQDLSSEGLGDRAKEAREERLQAIMRGEDPPPAKSEDAWRENLNAAHARIRELKKAEEMQQRELQAARQRVSAEIVKKLKPRDRELARTEALKLIEFLKARIERIDFLDELNQGQVSFSHELIPMGGHYGDVRDPHSRGAYVLLEYVSRGYLDAFEIPNEWRDFWMKRAGIKLEKWAA